MPSFIIFFNRVFTATLTVEKIRSISIDKSAIVETQACLLQLPK